MSAIAASFRYFALSGKMFVTFREQWTFVLLCLVGGCLSHCGTGCRQDGQVNVDVKMKEGGEFYTGELKSYGIVTDSERNEGFLLSSPDTPLT